MTAFLSELISLHFFFFINGFVIFISTFPGFEHIICIFFRPLYTETSPSHPFWTVIQNTARKCEALYNLVHTACTCLFFIAPFRMHLFILTFFVFPGKAGILTSSSVSLSEAERLSVFVYSQRAIPAQFSHFASVLLSLIKSSVKIFTCLFRTLNC